MAKKEKTSKIVFVIIGSLFLLIGVSLILYDFLSKRNVEINEQMAIEEFYTTQEEIKEESTNDTQKVKEVKKQNKINYIAILKIPKIDLERGLVDPKSYLNNVKYNLEIVEGSSMPDNKNSNLIIASHSGTARISYFRNLNKLSINDEILLIYKNKTYKYKVSNKYEIEKTGTAKIIRNNNKTTITLITCKYKTNKQIVVIADLQE
jgi:LPXTG-site transpeptidase (sortase) family protein